MREGRGMKGLRRAFALAAATAAIIGLAGCGADSGAQSEPTTYTNYQYGFTITYGEPLSQVNLTPSQGEEYAIAFADEDGSTVDDQLVNGIRVNVFEMAQAIPEDDVPSLQAEFEETLQQMVEALPGGTMVGSVEPLELNGTAGYAVDYQYTSGSEQLTCRLSVLIKGPYEFNLTEQALTGDWDSLSGTLHEAVGSFVLE